jgi:Uma2 family endonuclease
MSAIQTKIYTDQDYYSLPEDVRAELIEGQLIYNQAAPSRIHQTILGELLVIIKNYIKNKGGKCQVFPAPFAVELNKDKKTIVEPDISVICNLDKLTERGCVGAPDWIIEIVSPGNSSHDYVRKLNLYSNSGVREYWIVDPMKKRIFVYHLEKESFEVEAYSFHDKIKVNIYDDLVVDFEELGL